ncbi:MAG: phenylalanine--tRNA ligase subunit beta [Armatimonadetes bacterium]|nr:phenylalanine--tRNA ligase subunit beta [Armatimonadota bacterium]MDE2207148.1 phenylalanine--tRNA ligase subunit beta [Armatimonadota bacterium]
MRIPVTWLKELVPIGISVEELAAGLTMAGLEIESVEPGVDGEVLNAYITPNRGDCASILGVAREVAAIWTLPLRLPNIGPAHAGTAAGFQVSVQCPELCPRYAARLVTDVHVGPSPPDMQRRLTAAGMRPINNVVDVTNYVMLELGQPMHAFDRERLAGDTIRVRTAESGETLETLDGVHRSLEAGTLLIADSKAPIALAGVMGGRDTEIGPDTTSILLESASFGARAVRRTSRALGLRTEASYRFERGVDPDGAVRALARVCELLHKIGAGQPSDEMVDCRAAASEPVWIRFRPGRCGSLLGIPMDARRAVNCMGRLGITLRSRGAASEAELEALAPSWRSDLNCEEDLIEETGRIAGYGEIPERLPHGVTCRGGDSAQGLMLMEVRRALQQCGLSEVVTHSLEAPASWESEDESATRLHLRNVLSAEISTLRPSLLQGMLESAAANASHAAPATAIFQVGTVWQPEESLRAAVLVSGSPGARAWDPGMRQRPADYYTARGAAERLLRALRVDDVRFVQQPGGGGMPFGGGLMEPARCAELQLADGSRVGVAGEIQPEILRQMGIRRAAAAVEIDLNALRRAVPAAAPRWRPVPRFPASLRDLAPRLPTAVCWSQVDAAVRQAASPLVERFALTDLYEGPPLPAGVRAYTISFTLRSAERTLDDEDADAEMATLQDALQALGATFAS